MSGYFWTYVDALGGPTRVSYCVHPGWPRICAAVTEVVFCNQIGIRPEDINCGVGPCAALASMLRRLAAANEEIERLRGTLGDTGDD